MLKRMLATALLTASLLSPSISADFTYNQNTQTLTLIGDIVASDYTQLLSYTQTVDVKALRLTSDGGDFNAAVNMGALIHDEGLDTIASGGCYSSCAYMWLAGNANMYEVDSDAILGIHMPAVVSEDGKDRITSGVDFLDVGFYIAYIGVSYKAAHDIAGTPNDVIWLLSMDDIASWGISVHPWVDGRFRSGR